EASYRARNCEKCLHSKFANHARRAPSSRAEVHGAAVTRRRQTARTRALQGATHHRTRNSPQASYASGPHANVVPNGDIAEIFDRALTVLLREVERRKLARTDRTGDVRIANVKSRHVPAAVKREVWARDEGQCSFVGPGGRCQERGFLEFHHVIPFAEGGETSATNLQLRCRAHNAHEAREYFRATL